MGAGRPPKWTAEEIKEIKNKICERLGNGESLNKITKEKEYPAIATTMEWLAKDEEFLKNYARARETQADTLFYECLEIVDKATPENAQVARLQFDARRWMAGKLRPKKYGDKLDVEHQGSVNLVRMDAVTIDDKPLELPFRPAKTINVTPSENQE